jgi:hypothetical protein
VCTLKPWPATRNRYQAFSPSACSVFHRCHPGRRGPDTSPDNARARARRTAYTSASSSRMTTPSPCQRSCRIRSMPWLDHRHTPPRHRSLCLSARPGQVRISKPRTTATRHRRNARPRAGPSPGHSQRSRPPPQRPMRRTQRCLGAWLARHSRSTRVTSCSIMRPAQLLPRGARRKLREWARHVVRGKK